MSTDSKAPDRSDRRRGFTGSRDLRSWLEGAAGLDDPSSGGDPPAAFAASPDHSRWPDWKSLLRSDRLRQFDPPRIDTLLRAMRQLLDASERSMLYSRALDLVLEGVAAERGVLLLWEREKRRFHKISSRPWDGFSEAEMEQIFLAGEAVLRSGAGALLGAEACSIPPAGARDRGSHKSTRRLAGICVPMAARSQPLGVIYLDSSSGSRPFTPEELSFASLYAHIAGNCLETSGLISEVIQCNRQIASRMDEKTRGLSEGRGSPGAASSRKAVLPLVLENLQFSIATLNDGVRQLSFAPGELPLLDQICALAETVRRRISGLRLLSSPSRQESKQHVKLFQLVEVALTSLGIEKVPAISWLPASPEIQVLTDAVPAARWIIARMLEAVASLSGTTQARILQPRGGNAVALEFYCSGDAAGRSLRESSGDLGLARLIAWEILGGDLEWEEDQAAGEASLLLRLTLPGDGL